MGPSLTDDAGGLQMDCSFYLKVHNVIFDQGIEKGEENYPDFTLC